MNNSVVAISSRRIPSRQPTHSHKKESSSGMKTRTQLPILLLAAGLALGPAMGWSQQGNSDRTDAGQDHSAKQDMKQAGRDTKGAAEDAGRGTKKGTEKAYHSTKSGTKKAWNKTKSTTKGAVNGGKQGAKQPQ
jgi:hypothetical protein